MRLVPARGAVSSSVGGIRVSIGRQPLHGASMNSNVVQFPGSDERAWRSIEADIRDGLRVRGLRNTEAVLDVALPNIRRYIQSLFEGFSIPVSRLELPSDLDQGQRDLILSRVNDITAGLVTSFRERLSVERVAAMGAVIAAEVRAADMEVNGPE